MENEKELLAAGRAPNFRRVVEQAVSYAASPWPVLILGETGSGKELFARRIHSGSKRARANFVAINCGALPPALFESEIFGHERGAFSGAVLSSRGLARLAHGGTLFLDEIGDLDLLSQVKLLRMLDSGEVRPVGSARTEKLDLRIVAATNVDLYGAVREGRFRHDLLERLGVLTLNVPPLRERREDISGIARTWLLRIGCVHDSAALAPLLNYDWPGNVRQLKNFLVRVATLSGERLNGHLLRQLLEEERATTMSFSGNANLWDGSLADIEKKVIVDRLKRCQGNRKRTASELGIAKSTLHEKLRRWEQTQTLRAIGEMRSDRSRLALGSALSGGGGAPQLDL